MTAINFSNALGMHPDYLEFRAARAEVLASNIANADTPGFKARDLIMTRPLEAGQAFGQHMQGQLALSPTRGGSDNFASLFSSGEPDSVPGSSPHPEHFAISIENARSLARDSRFESRYRIPSQQSGLDGNSVDVQRESAEFARNALDFSVSFRLLNSRFAGLSKAISGE